MATTMPDLILHHFLISPFSEKVRAVLGYKHLAWRSVIVPGVMPKPDVIALTGGYRRTPFLQIGADIYCDSALICEVLEQREPEPTLYPAAIDGIARTLAQWIDSTLFWTALAAPRDTATMFAQTAPEEAARFGADRAAMKVGMPALRAADAAAACKTYLQRLAGLLGTQPFLFGSAPCIADFSLYQICWFSLRYIPAVASLIRADPLLSAWCARMEAIGHGDAGGMSSAQAIAVAAAAEPLSLGGSVFQDEHGIALGSQVAIRAESFGPEVTEGVLVGATADRYTLRRHDARAHTVHVHFPRIGYVLEELHERL